MTVQNNLTLVDDCEGAGTWTVFNISGSMGTLLTVTATSEDMTVPVQGTNCYGFDCDKEIGGFECALAGATDLSKEHLYVWVSVPTALGGLEVMYPGSGQAGLFLTARDSSGNRGYWHVAGRDTYDGAWKCFVAYLGDAPDTNSGTAPNMTQITHVGMGVNHLYAKSKAACNIFFDVTRYGNNGISIYGGSVGSELDFDHIVSGDASAAIGMMRRYGGIYYAQGPIKFGHDSQSCYFKDTGKTIVFEDAEHLSGELYKFEILEGSGQQTHFQLGNISGTQGIQGCSIQAAIGQDWNFLFSGETIEEVNLYGSTFRSTKKVVMSQSGERAVLSCAFVDQTSGEIFPNGISFEYNNIINPVKTGMVLDNQNDPDIANCNFIACPIGVEFRDSGEYSWSNVKFTNCVVDVWNTSGGNVTINCSNGSNPANTSGEFTIVNTVRHYVSNVKQNSEVTYVSGEGDSASVLYHMENMDGTGTTYYEYSYAGDFYVDILIMHLDYEPFLQTVLLSDTTQTLPISQVEDRVYSG